ATEESLWFDVTVKSPLNSRGLMNYGLVKMEQGDFATAEKYFLEGLSLTPDYPFLLTNLGVLNSAKGNQDEAEKYFRLSVQYGSEYPATNFYYGKHLYQMKRTREAIPYLEKALSQNFGYEQART